MSRRQPELQRPTVRCAIYTRKSTEEGLQQEFNSLDAQRESAEAFIKSQANEGWECLPTRYDDGGYSGGNTDRPALRRLLSDIEAGKVDCVVVYKVDRLSRSLLDFAKMMEVFDQHKISFVSVTQQFNTTHSMGRLTLNILLSFAQFEREIISERTRDKIAATRKKGKWTGGRPVLGYDISPHGTRLVVNEIEAIQVRTIFDLYLQHRSLLAVIREMDVRGWRTKEWVTKAGVPQGGQPMTKTILYQLLTNVLYVGQVRHKEQVFPGEHDAIVDDRVFAKVQAYLAKNGRDGGVESRNKYGALLKGLLHCTHCRCTMIHHYTSKGSRRYRYYVCQTAQKRGYDNCPAPSLPAGEIEQFVVDQIKHIGRDPDLISETLTKAREHVVQRTKELQGELVVENRQRQRDEAELKKLVGSLQGEAALARLADLQDRLRISNDRTRQLQTEIECLAAEDVSEDDVATALSQFDEMWGALSAKEQARVLHLLIERVDHNPDTGEVTLTFHPTGLISLQSQFEESAA